MNRRHVFALFVAALVTVSGAARPHTQAAPAVRVPQESGRGGPAAPPALIAAERAIAATVSEPRMVEAVRRLVAIGTRMYGTPSNHESAAWLAAQFGQAGLEVAIRQDTPRDWYQPVSWEVRIARDAAPDGGAAPAPIVLKTTWPNMGTGSGAGEAPLAIDAAPGSVCLVSRNPTPDTTSGCVAVLFDGRVSSAGWPIVGRSRVAPTVPVFVLAPREANLLRERAAAGEKLRVRFTLEAKAGKGPGETVVATLPGKDRSKYILFCAHGDADSGGPGADDNASGVATVLEIARAAAAAVKSGRIAQPAWDIRFAAWGGEIASSREYLASLGADLSKLQAVFNFDQAGFGSTRDALYVEPDDVPANAAVMAVVRAVMAEHIGAPGFPAHAASLKSQGGTDSYEFQNPRTPGAVQYPAVTLSTSSWDKPQQVPLTPGFPPLNWYPDEKPGMITVDGDAFYHSVGDTPANTTDTKPADMGWCARVGLISALRLMADPTAAAAPGWRRPGP
ncbi:MAG: M28 family peptidase [Acidobacteriota bacterium]